VQRITGNVLNSKGNSTVDTSQGTAILQGPAGFRDFWTSSLICKLKKSKGVPRQDEVAQGVPGN